VQCGVNFKGAVYFEVFRNFFFNIVNGQKLKFDLFDNINAILFHLEQEILNIYEKYLSLFF